MKDNFFHKALDSRFHSTPLSPYVSGGGHRSEIWPLLLLPCTAQLINDDRKNRKDPISFADMVVEATSSLSDAVKQEIELDVSRTELISGNEGEMIAGVTKLRSVLITYSYRNPAVGYCQGMNFIAAGLLRYLDVEKAFWAMCVLVEQLITGHHEKNMIGGKADQRVLEDLLLSRHAEILYHLDGLHFDLGLITTQWFIPMYLHALPEEVVFQIWDIIFTKLYHQELEEASAVLFSVAMVIVESDIGDILSSTDPGEVLNVLLSYGSKKLDSPEKVDTFIESVNTSVSSIPKDYITTTRNHHLKQLRAELSIDGGLGKMKIVYVNFGVEPLGLTYGVDKTTGKGAVLRLDADKITGAQGPAEKSGRVAEGSVIVSLNGDSVVGQKAEEVIDKMKKLRESNVPITIGFYNDEMTNNKLRVAMEARLSKPSYDNDNFNPELLDGEQFFCISECKVKESTINPAGDLVIWYRPCKLFMTNYRVIIHKYPAKWTNSSYYASPRRHRMSSVDGTPVPVVPRISKSSSSGGSPAHNKLPELQIPKLISCRVQGDVQLPILAISSIHVTSPVTMEIGGKDLRLIELSFQTDAFCHKLHEMMNAVVLIDNLHFAFAFSKGVSSSFTITAGDPTDPRNLLMAGSGWNIYQPEKEYERLGILHSPKFRLVKQSNYNICSSYPSMFLVPRSITDEEIDAVSKFRSKGRLPVISWVHPVTKAILARAAQPLVGLSNQKCDQDIKLLSAILASSGKRRDIYEILDCRSSVAAMGNKTMGKGTENVSIYPGAEIMFMNIQNIHAVRGSLELMAKLMVPSNLKSDDDSFWKRLSDTGWYKLVRGVIVATLRIIMRLESDGVTVFTHCSDGWDRTPQVVSLALLLLDPYYRTKEGFCVLVEKEWCSFGHQFSKRCGHIMERDVDEQSPVFLQWVDCVWQCTRQFPSAFEFNETFLITMVDHTTSGRFGTFLMNSEKERKELKSEEQSASVWSLLLHPAFIDMFTNRDFKPCDGTIIPSGQSKHLQFWDGYFNRHDPSSPRKVTAYL